MGGDRSLFSKHICKWLGFEPLHAGCLRSTGKDCSKQELLASPSRMFQSDVNHASQFPMLPHLHSLVWFCFLHLVLVGDFLLLSGETAG